MGPGRQLNDDQRDRANTLGDLLFGKTAKPPAPEAVWAGLVRAIAAGDQQALHALYAQTHRLVFTLIMRIVSNRETAEELTVDVFYDVWRRASAYDPANGSVIGWILNQARSRALDRLRFEQRKKRVDDPGASLPQAAERDPQEAFAAKEQARRLQGALQVLTPNERTAIETAFFSELTYIEAAARLNEPVGTVKTRLRSGLTKLRQSLAGITKGV